MPSISEFLACVIGFLLIVILGLSIWLYVDGNRISSLKAENAEFTTANEDFKAQVDAQNAAIQKFKTDQTSLANALAVAQKAVAQKDATLEGALTHLQQVKPSTDACKAANDLFNNYLGGK